MRIIEVPGTRRRSSLGQAKGEGTRFLVPAGWCSSEPEGFIEVIRRPEYPVLIKMSMKPREAEDNRAETKLRQAVQELQRVRSSPDLDEADNAGTS